MPKKSRRRCDTKKKQGRRPPVNVKQAKEGTDISNENSIEEQDPGSEHLPGNNETESVDLSPRVCLPFSPDLTNHSEVTASGTTCEMSAFNSFCPSAEEYDKSANISDEQEVNNHNGVPDILQSPSTYNVEKHTETAYNPDMSPLYFPFPNDDELAAGYASDTDILLKAKQKVDAFLPRRWISVVDRDHLNVMCLSNQQRQKAIQRSLEFDKDGKVRLFVHCKPFDVTPYLPKSKSAVPLPINWYNLNECVDMIVCIVNNLRSMEVCSGYDDEVYQDVWHSCEYGEIDKNPYQECRYVETFRSLSCKLLVKSNKWRCPECTKMLKPLKRRALAAAQESRPKNTPNIALTEDQKLKKLKDQRKEIDNLKAKLSRVRVRMQEVIKKESLQLDHQLADSLTNLLNESDLSPAQSVFLQQQVKASQVKSASGMRWHPTMIRLALSLHITSPAAYEMLRNTGMVKLPSSRTLFDYSHARPAEEGIDKAVLEKLAETVEEMSEKINAKTQKKEVHKRYHVLMGDEMYISQNLVFQKSTGQMVGFTSLDEIDKELKSFEQTLDKPEEECRETIASRIMVYMVKGVTNGIKKVIATFAVNTMSALQMKVWTWQVIGALERSGIAVIAMVCDGSSVNRAFIKSHTPATIHPSGIIFDTWNKCAKDRKLFFLSDVPHLLKTTRNCFLNSRWDNKKSRRRMFKNGSRISWEHIIKLYEAKRGKTLRKSYKLSPMNVYPDSYARMKVKYAGQVMSKTVALDLRSQGWPEVKETANFIQLVNDWFDCLNGAHTSIAVKTRNTNLAAYTSTTDSRFDLLNGFLKYLDDWESDAKSNPNSTIDLNSTGAVEDLDGSAIEELDDGENLTPINRKLLSKQTLEGIRMSTLAFQPLVTFMLEEGATFINARVFTQDPLEQHFSKLRAGQGGSSHPNLRQTLKRNRDLDTIGEMGIKKRKGNSGQHMDNAIEVTTEKLPKLQSARIPKFAVD